METQNQKASITVLLTNHKIISNVCEVKPRIIDGDFYIDIRMYGGDAITIPHYEVYNVTPIISKEKTEIPVQSIVRAQTYKIALFKDELPDHEYTGLVLSIEPNFIVVIDMDELPDEFKELKSINTIKSIVIAAKELGMDISEALATCYENIAAGIIDENIYINNIQRDSGETVPYLVDDSSDCLVKFYSL